MELFQEIGWSLEIYRKMSLLYESRIDAEATRCLTHDQWVTAIDACFFSLGNIQQFIPFPAHPSVLYNRPQIPMAVYVRPITANQ